MHVRRLLQRLRWPSDVASERRGTPIRSNLEYRDAGRRAAGPTRRPPAAAKPSFARDGGDAADDDPLHALDPADRAGQAGERGVADAVGVDQLAARRTCPRRYDPATGRVTADAGAYDPLLDAIASSRGRIGFSTSGAPALVVPPWAEVARVIEDCRV